MNLHERLDRHGGRRFFGGGNGDDGEDVSTILKELNFCNDDGDQADPDLIRIGNVQTFSGTPPWPFIKGKAKYYYPRTEAEPIKSKREYSEEDLANIRETLLQWRSE